MQSDLNGSPSNPLTEELPLDDNDCEGEDIDAKFREFGAIAQSIAPVGIMMSLFTLIYSLWFGFAWGAYGWVAFAATVLFCAVITRISIGNIKHSSAFEAISTDRTASIEKKMKRLSAISYSVLWLSVIVLAILHQIKFIFPVATLIIGTHFLPQAKIMGRKIDYFIAPIPIIFSGFSIWLGFMTEMNWLILYAIAGIGGCAATMIYAVYMVYSFNRIVEIYRVSREQAEAFFNGATR